MSSLTVGGAPGIFYVLEDAFTCVLANAAQIAQVPGRKTDVKDGVWIAQRLEHGLVRGSFVPPASIRELRDLTRYRAALIGEHTRETNRLQKVLEDAGIKLASVASNVLGVSGRARCFTVRRQDGVRLAANPRRCQPLWRSMGGSSRPSPCRSEAPFGRKPRCHRRPPGLATLDAEGYRYEQVSPVTPARVQVIFYRFFVKKFLT
jgi:hypothetical protein